MKPNGPPRLTPPVSLYICYFLIVDVWMDKVVKMIVMLGTPCIELL